MTIAILCPTRGRPEQCRRMIESAARTADNPFIMLACPESEYEHYRSFNGASNFGFSHIQVPDNLPTAHKWNFLAECVMKSGMDAKLFMLGSDDMVFDTPGWDMALLEHYAALENKVHCFSLQDSRDENGTPHPIFTREWIEFFGYMVCPIMLHWWIDTWAVEIAKHNGVFTHLKDYLLVHDKPSDRGQPDETFSRIRSWGWKDRDDYVNRTCRHFLELEKQRLGMMMNVKGSEK